MKTALKFTSKIARVIPSKASKVPQAPQAPQAPLTKAEKRALRSPAENEVLTNAALKAWATRRAKAAAVAAEVAKEVAKAEATAKPIKGKRKAS